MMKKTIILAITLFATAFQGQSQNDAISRFFGQYQDREDVTTIAVTGKIFEMMSEFDAESESEQEFQNLASQIHGLHMIVDSKDADSKSTARSALKKVEREFEELMTIKEKSTQINVLVDEANGIVSEILVIVGADSSFVVASLTGKMLLKDVGKLTSQMSQVGKEMFAESAVTPVSIDIYPNPVLTGEPISIRLPEELEGADVRIFNASGREVGAYKAGRGEKRFDTSKIGKGTYILKAEKGSTLATSKFVVN